VEPGAAKEEACLRGEGGAQHAANTRHCHLSHSQSCRLPGPHDQSWQLRGVDSSFVSGAANEGTSTACSLTPQRLRDQPKANARRKRWTVQYGF